MVILFYFMKILVTGGVGFIGKNLVKSLVKNNTITIYDNLENSSEKSISPLIESESIFVKEDILDYELFKKNQVLEIIA